MIIPIIVKNKEAVKYLLANDCTEQWQCITEDVSTMEYHFSSGNIVLKDRAGKCLGVYNMLPFRILELEHYINSI